MIIEVTKQHIKSIKEKLEQQLPITKKDVNWLRSQKVSFNNKPNDFNTEKLVLLDSLIPLLGYDWRNGMGAQYQKRKENIVLIKKQLTEGKAPSYVLKNWLEQQQIQYEKDPSKLKKAYIQELDTLNPLLGYDWKERYRVTENRAKENIRQLSSLLKSNRKVPKKIQFWLKAQRSLYKAHPKTYSKKNKEQLDALTPLLGYDWKEKRGVSHSKLSFSERIEAIKNSIQSNGKPTKKEFHWIGKYRRSYLENPKNVTLSQIELLDTLTPLLNQTWKESFKPVSKSKDFVTKLKEIKTQKLTYEELTQIQKKWLQIERRKYLKNKEEYSSDKLKALNSIIKILGRDWKKYVTKKPKKITTLKEYITIIEKKLTIKIPLGVEEKRWLQKNRKYFKEGKLSEDIIYKLDQFIPLLGYDWKVNQLNRTPKKTFEEHIEDITKILTSNGKLNKAQQNFLIAQREYYQRDPQEYPIYKIQLLDSLIPLLKRDWKIKIMKVPKKLSFEETLVAVRHCLILGKELTKKQQAWLGVQRLAYKRKEANMTGDRINILNSLNQLLGYDWKTYVSERKSKEEV